MATDILSKIEDVRQKCVDILSRIDDVGPNWSTVSEEFRDEMNILQEKLDCYAELTRKYKLAAEGSTMIMALRNAQSTLDRADWRLNLEKGTDNNGCCSLAWLLYAKLAVVIFPEKLENIVKKVTENLDKIPEMIKKEEEFKSLMKRRQLAAVKSEAIQITVDDGGLYVPIKRSETQVTEALENFEIGSHSIILLHGGLGKGKSTVARRMCQLYGKDGDKPGVFDYVIFVLCGGNSLPDPSTKQFEILQQLDPNGLGSMLKEEGGGSNADNIGSSLKKEARGSNANNVGSSLNKEATSGSSGKEEALGSKVRIARVLQEFLQDKRILIVLDDLSHEGFLMDMWKVAKRASRVKYLVTSQKSDLCKSLWNDSKPIGMGDPEPEEAEMILASLVGLREKSNNGMGKPYIPEHLKDIIQKIINDTGGNPLALACLASSFVDDGDKRDKRAWQYTHKELRERLNDPETTSVLGSDTPRSLWSAMKLCIESLENRDAKDVLYLIYACKGSAVPEEVLHILHSAKKTKTNFIRSRGELQTKELLKRNQGSFAPKDEEFSETTSWSLLTLVRLYMDANMANKEEIKIVMGTLFGTDEILSESGAQLERDPEIEAVQSEETRVVIALCALYFNPTHTDKAIAEVTQRARDASSLDSNDSINDLRRKAVEPIIWLLDQPEEEHIQWTATNIGYTRQIFLQYVSQRRLDGDRICGLLKLVDYPSAPLAILEAVTRICDIEETPVLNETSLSFLSPLVGLLNSTEGIKASIRKAASRALRSISRKATREKSTSLILKTPGILALLVRSIQDLLIIPTGLPHDEGEDAISTLKCLAWGEEPDPWNIVSQEGALAVLVKLLYRDDKPGLQTASAQVLGNLAIDGNDLTKWKIIEEDGALTGLVKSLSKDNNSELQKHAAWALNVLASGEDSIKSKILNEDSALVELINSLSRDNNSGLQEEAALALWELAEGEDGLKKIIKNEMALVELVKSLSKDANPGLQRRAAGALGALAEGEDSIKATILNQDGALARLLKLLSKEDNKELQERAAWALKSLASGEDSIKIKILNEDNALVDLIQCLSYDSNPDLQEAAAATLWDLAAGEDALKWKIVENEVALAELVKSLSDDANPSLQRRAAGAFGALAEGEDSIKATILNQDGALVGLLKLLSKDENSRLQSQAAWALKNLASGEDSLKSKIVNEDNALVSLIKCLSNDSNSDLQEIAAAVLWDLAEGEDDLKWELVKNEVALVELVKSLSKDANPSLQRHAAGALGALGKGGDSIKATILNHDGALSGLVKSLSKDENGELQEQAARSLQSLASGEDSLKSKILNQDRTLANLSKCLYDDDKPLVQERAANVLLELAKHKEKSTKMQIAQGGIAPLITSLSKNENAALRANAAGALVWLTDGVPSVRLKIMNEDGALASLVKLLSNYNHSVSQANAAWVLGNLAAEEPESLSELKGSSTRCAIDGPEESLQQEECTSQQRGELDLRSSASCQRESTAWRIADEKGAVEELVKLLEHADGHVQERATRALANLACAGDTIIAKILNEDGALSSLVKSLSKQNRPIRENFPRDSDLLEQTVRAFASFACAGDPIKLKIVSEDGALPGLVKALSEHSKPALQKLAARALSNVAKTEDPEIILKIRNEGGLLTGLRNLSKQSDRGSQEQAQAALENLGEKDGSSTEKVTLGSSETS